MDGLGAGMASDDIGDYYDKLTDAIKDTEAWQEAQRDIEETHKELIKPPRLFVKKSRSRSPILTRVLMILRLRSASRLTVR